MSTIAEYRRNSLYDSASSRERRAAAKAPRDPVAELSSQHLDERRELERKQRAEGMELRSERNRQHNAEHGGKTPHRAPLLDKQQDIEREALHQRHGDEYATLSARQQGAMTKAVKAHPAP